MTQDGRKIKVMLLINSTAGGVGLHGIYMGRYLDPERFDLTIGYGPGYPFDGELNKLPVRVEPFHLSRKIKPQVNLRGFWEIFSYLKRGKFDAIAIEGSMAGFIGRIAAWLAGTPVRIFIIQLQAAHPNQPKLKQVVFRTIERWIDSITTHYVAVSGAMVKYGSQCGIFPPEKSDVIYNGISLDDKIPVDRTEACRALGLDPARPVVGTLARFEKQKGLRYLVEALPKVLAQFPETQFMMAGEGPLEEELKAQARELGVESALHWVGWVRNVPEAISAMDIYCMPSLWESFGIAFAEASAMARPVVATTVDGIPEVIAHGETGLLLAPRDSEGLAGALIELLSDPARREAMGRAGRARVEAKFTVEEMIRRYENVFERLCRPDAVPGKAEG